MMLEDLKFMLENEKGPFSYRVREKTFPRMRVTHTIEPGDTKESQWEALERTVERFDGDVEIKIGFHWPFCKERMGATKWLKIERPYSRKQAKSSEADPITDAKRRATELLSPFVPSAKIW